MFWSSKAIVVRKKLCLITFPKCWTEKTAGWVLESAVQAVFGYGLSSDFSDNPFFFYFVYPGLPRSEWKYHLTVLSAWH